MSAGSHNSNADDAPRRAIYNDADIQAFLDSPTHKELLRFVEGLGRSCATADVEGEDGSSNELGDGASDPYFHKLTPSMACLHGALRQMATWIDEIPPLEQADSATTIRFGNPAFRAWNERLVARSAAIVAAVIRCKSGEKSNAEASQLGWDAAAGTGEIGSHDDSSLIRVSCYLHDAFGHPIRLDYGTGHETAFIVFLFVLSKLGCFGSSPDVPVVKAVALSVFNRYLDVTRRLQDDYRLEPAGSHGVWGLDDYYCLAFYFGACQLSQPGNAVPNELASPSSILHGRSLETYHRKFMYLASIRYIQHIKQNVPFFESSPMLYDISQSMPTWQKVSRGLLRLYEGEVLGKRQVVQHLLFSPKLFEATWSPSRGIDLVAPNTTFRDGADSRAPWATGRSSGPLPTTRAPWASASGGPMPPTRRTPSSNSTPHGPPTSGLGGSEAL